MSDTGSWRWKAALDANITFLQDNLLLTEVFYGYLIQKEIFTEEIIETIRGGLYTTEGRILKLVTYLKRRDYECFQKFLFILQKTDNHHVKTKLEESISEAQKKVLEDLSELNKQKDKRIMELELEMSDLKKKCYEAEKIATCESERSKYYLEVIKHLSETRTNSGSSSILEERNQEIEEMEEEMEILKDQVDTLESHLNERSQDLQRTKKQLNSALERERKVKRNLGLRDDASEQEVSAKIQEIRSNEAEFQRFREETESITEMKDVYNDKINQLTKAVKRLETEKLRKENRLRRIKTDSDIIRTARSILSTKKAEELKLPLINIGSNSPAVENKWHTSARNPNTQKIICQSSVSSPREPKYCVLCRKEYFIREVCRIHTASIHDGKYPCCNAPARGQPGSQGCITLRSHLYVHFTDVVGECMFYDQNGRQFTFQETDTPIHLWSNRR